MLQLVISLCIGASVMMELVVELVRAEIFVLNVASLSARPAGQLGPLKARQPPGLFAVSLATRAQPAAPVLVCVVRVSSSLP